MQSLLKSKQLQRKIERDQKKNLLLKIKINTGIQITSLRHILIYINKTQILIISLITINYSEKSKYTIKEMA